MRWKHSLPIILILGLGCILRCVHIGTRGIWYDEAFSILLARQDLRSVISGAAADTMPPLYFFLLHLFLKMSHQIWWLRLLNIFISLVNLYLIYRMMNRLAGKKAGIVTGFITAISPIHIYQAQEVYIYTLLVLGLVLYAYSFIRIWQADKRSSEGKANWFDWLGLAAGGVIAMYSHNLAVFTLIVPNIWLIIRGEWKKLFKLILAQFVIFAFALPWLMLIPGQVSKIQAAFWIPRPGLVELIQTVVVFCAAIPLPGIWQGIAIVISIEVLVFTCLGLYQRRKESGAETGLLFSFAVLPPLMIFLISYVMRPVFVPRGFLFSSIAYFGLVGLVAASKTSRISGWFALGGFVLASVIAIPYQTTYHRFPRSPYQKAIETIRPLVEEGDVIVHDNKLSFFPSYYYAPQLPQQFLADEPGAHNDTLAPATQQAMNIFPKPDLPAAIGESKRVFFIVFEKAIQEYRAMGYPDHPNLAWLRQRYRLAQQWHFEDLIVYLFDEPS